MMSMTGFAHINGQHTGIDWALELRSVNNKGLDMRLRIPDTLSALEQPWRKAIGAKITRGSIQLSLRIGGSADAHLPKIDPDRLKWAMGIVETLQTQAKGAGIDCAPTTVSDIVSLRPGIFQQGESFDPETWLPPLTAGLEQALADLVSARRVEGAELYKILSGHLKQIADLCDQAQAVLLDRHSAQKSFIQDALSRLTAAEVDPDRLEQELALLAVKSDVTEELDRLQAHIQMAYDYLSSDTAVGRKFDFLMQEFNREANTLCSKSNYHPLTRIGLEMKTVIDQMREQVQNVE